MPNLQYITINQVLNTDLPKNQAYKENGKLNKKKSLKF